MEAIFPAYTVTNAEYGQRYLQWIGNMPRKRVITRQPVTGPPTFGQFSLAAMHLFLYADLEVRLPRECPVRISYCLVDDGSLTVDPPVHRRNDAQVEAAK
jgi:hypothetical protein